MTFLTEQLVEAVLLSGTPGVVLPERLRALVRGVLDFDCNPVRVVVLGGGTGLSTVVGGNSRLAGWPANPNLGLKQVFPNLDVVVCTTDDGGATGELLKQLPMIGIGDLRKLCLSMVEPGNLRRRYGLDGGRAQALVRVLHSVFNHRFPREGASAGEAEDPLLAAPAPLRDACPEPLRDLLRAVGRFVTPGGGGPAVEVGGQCLGNLLLTSAIFAETGGEFRSPPAMAAIRRGIDRIADAIGARPGRLHPATAAPGQLVFRYANGVELHGQSKSATSRRGVAVDRVYPEFYGVPEVPAEVLRMVREADLILLAPGSLYTSSIPTLQVPGIASAIRENRTALKVLGANLWVEKGETDIAHEDRGRGFRVSEILDAYERNVPGGRAGLFNVVLAANLQHLSGDVLRNYALEGKKPIYLDRRTVEAMDVEAVESTIFSVEHGRQSGFIHHDPKKFALAIRALLFAREHGRLGRTLASAGLEGGAPAAGAAGGTPAGGLGAGAAVAGHRAGPQPLCDYWAGITSTLGRKRFQPDGIREVLRDIAWRNRDIQARHFDLVAGARVVPAAEWKRNTEWDSVLGYYDPEDRCLRIHEQVLEDPNRLQGNLLVALGESLLGRYVQERSWARLEGAHGWGARRYEIRLLPPGERDCLLGDARLHEYLALARMVPHPEDRERYGITLNDGEGFLPPGLLFGLMYAWYLDNSCAAIMENEMAILHWPEATLIPSQAHEYRRKKALVAFFREAVFGHEVYPSRRTISED